VSIGADGPPLTLSVNPLAVLICLPEVCRKLTQAPLAKGVSAADRRYSDRDHNQLLAGQCWRRSDGDRVRHGIRRRYGRGD
jgi:hypothetical protein